MTAALRRVVGRMFPDGRCAKAVAFRRDFQALERRLGPFDDTTVQYAAAVVAFNLEFQDTTAAVQRAQELRRNGKGRRPSGPSIERLKRRQGLSWQTYDAAMRRLEDLARERPAGRGGLAAVEDAVRRANAR